MEILSVITVCYNAEEDIHKTLESIISQTANEFEYIIVDGKSTDNTVEIINNYIGDIEKKGIKVKLISEKDKGVYDAMNKGIKNASGQWIEFLNAGDEYCNETVLEDIIHHLTETQADVIYGDYYSVSDDLKQLHICDHTHLKKDMTLGHESCFIRRNVHKQFLYDLNYKIASDYNSLLRIYLHDFTFQHVDTQVIKFYTNGISSIHKADAYREVHFIRVKNKVINQNIVSIFGFLLNYLKIKMYYEFIPKRMIDLWEALKHENKEVVYH